MNKKYEKPDFDVTVYEIEDIITVSGVNNDLIIDQDPDGDGWFG